MAMRVLPGQRLGPAAEFDAGSGTYVRAGHVHASVVGNRSVVLLEERRRRFDLSLKQLSQEAFHQQKPPSLPLMTVVRDRQALAVPEIGNIVIGKVTRVNPRFAALSIMVVETTPCTESFQGVIRVQDVRATEKDKVQIYRSFRPGDVVRAQVISLGDSRSYYLSTAQNELGVVIAQSMAGFTMVPISWEEMICPETKVVEYRKCAKPVDKETSQ